MPTTRYPYVYADWDDAFVATVIDTRLANAKRFAATGRFDDAIAEAQAAIDVIAEAKRRQP